MIDQVVIDKPGSYDYGRDIDQITWMLCVYWTHVEDVVGKGVG